MSTADSRVPKKRKASSKHGPNDSSPRSSEKRRRLPPPASSDSAPEMEHDSEPLEPSLVQSHLELNDPAIPVVSTAAVSEQPSRNVERLPPPASRGSLTVVLKRALYGCVQSAALWYANLCATMSKLG
jgi:hypothetical protein